MNFEKHHAFVNEGLVYDFAHSLAIWEILNAGKEHKSHKDTLPSEKDLNEYIKQSGLDNCEKIDEKNRLLMKLSAIEKSFAIGLPYHSEFADSWIESVELTPLNEVELVICAELTRYERIFPGIYKVKWGARDVRYLWQILYERLKSPLLAEHEAVIKKARLEEGIQFLKAYEVKVCTQGESEKNSLQVEKIVAHKKLLNIEEYLTLRFNKSKLDSLLINIGLVEISGENIVSKYTQEPWQWAALKKALTEKLLLNSVSDNEAARLFKEAYGAKVSRATINNFIPGEKRQRMNSKDNFYYKIIECLPNLL